ncbi:MAG TPA: hypothetical protein VGP07_17090 [Polyangia bacterium]|jgi:hypothetical protein
MSYGFNDPFSAAPPSVQIQRVGGWKLLAGAMLAAAGVGFAGFVYVGPYKKTTTALHERTTELGKERGATDDLSSERDRLKAEVDKRQAAEQEKAGGEAKRHEALEGLAAELKVALAAVGANIAVDDSRIGVSLTVASLFAQPMSVAISPQGETALRVVVAGLKKTGMRGKVKARLIPSAPPRELAQFKNIGEFEMLRAARIMLVLAADGVPADHLAVAGELAAPAGRKTKGGVPDRLDIEIEPE